MTAEEVAEQTVRAVGRQSVLVTGVVNQLTATALRFVPRSMVARATAGANASRVRDDRR